MPEPALSISRLSKSFGGRAVVRDLDLDVHAGEVHALIGQNGSGKSTIIKILAGLYAPGPDAELTVYGKSVALPLNAGTTHRLGLSFVHQDLALANDMTVLENIRAGGYETGFGWRVRWRDERRAVRRALAGYALEGISPDQTVGSLSEVERAMVAIVRALEPFERTGHGVLVLDEPTAYLPRDGVQRLFTAVRAAAARGAAVLFVTHRLDEVLVLADRVTILRDGAVVETGAVAVFTEQDLIERIIGRNLGALYPSRVDTLGNVALSVAGVAGVGLAATDLHIRAGEILGLTGLVGMGHERVPYLLVGARRATSGQAVIAETVHDLRTITPREAIRGGIALLPANRLRDGQAADATVEENLTLPALGRYFRRGRLQHREARRSVSALLQQFQVVPPVSELPMSKLSGGNQQKALLAKWFSIAPQVFLMHEPTQGVDVGARQQIFGLIEQFRRGGGATLLISTEYDDLAHLCDRVMIFRDGRAVSELPREELSPERILERCYSGDLRPVSAT